MTDAAPGSPRAAPPPDLDGAAHPDVGIRDVQALVRATYGARDRARGIDAGLGWFIEEVGELSRAVRRQGHEERVVEFSDVMAWLVSLADLAGVDLAAAMDRYADGCPKCHGIPCTCG